MSAYRVSQRPSSLIEGDRVRVTFSLWARFRSWLGDWTGSAPIPGAWWHGREGVIRCRTDYFGCSCGMRSCPHGDGKWMPGAIVDLDGCFTSSYASITFPLQRLERRTGPEGVTDYVK